ncbi:hypothetical protein [Rhizobium mongolense]|uniref:Uncharacterized protein n=1 Tax=Rhizobium mongolense TaxID=57676 RepID=A0ABR6IMY5_9HYPH|nr:hypothetical protein [Rhizobium mongolense]MBB4228874.1 hypothetical protein [Rhizobium mongolense]
MSVIVANNDAGETTVRADDTGKLLIQPPSRMISPAISMRQAFTTGP